MVKGIDEEEIWQVSNIYNFQKKYLNSASKRAYAFLKQTRKKFASLMTYPIWNCQFIEADPAQKYIN